MSSVGCSLADWLSADQNDLGGLAHADSNDILVEELSKLKGKLFVMSREDRDDLLV